MYLTICACSLSTSNPPSSFGLKPRTLLYANVTLPSAACFRLDHVIFSDIDLLSSCAKELIIVISNSPFESNVQMFSFSKYISTPTSFSFLTVDSESTVFLANLLTLLVNMRSILPASASFTIS